ncbi:MAG: hypothetical protein HKM24_01200 [Gammaproteobacteria bacterium]|nr:hypothetical protein [Gammaproteobacteria bacterium]
MSKPQINPDDVAARTMFLKDQYFRKQLKEAEGKSKTLELIASGIYVLAVIAAFVLILLTMRSLPGDAWIPITGVLVFAMVGLHLLHLRLTNLQRRFDSILNTVTQIKEEVEDLYQGD